MQPNSCFLPVSTKRRESESNRRIELLQSSALPLGYPAVNESFILLNFFNLASRRLQKIVIIQKDVA